MFDNHIILNYDRYNHQQSTQVNKMFEICDTSYLGQLNNHQYSISFGLMNIHL